MAIVSRPDEIVSGFERSGAGAGGVGCVSDAPRSAEDEVDAPVAVVVVGAEVVSALAAPTICFAMLKAWSALERIPPPGVWPSSAPGVAPCAAAPCWVGPPGVGSSPVNLPAWNAPPGTMLA